MPGPWEKYQQSAGPWTKYQQPQQQQAPQQQQGFLSSFVNNSPLGFASAMIQHPIDTLGSIPSALAGEAGRVAGQLKEAWNTPNNQPMKAVDRTLYAIPFVGASLKSADEQAAAGNYSGAAGSGLGAMTTMLVPDALERGAKAAVNTLPGAAKAAIVGNLDKPIPGTNITPRQRYAAAQNLGVDLNAADATNSPVLKAVKQFNENSLLGSGAYDRARAANVQALHGSTEDILNQIYPGDRESGGVAIQEALRNNQQGLQADAAAGFASLPQDIPISEAANIGAEAREILEQHKSYHQQFPSLQPTKTLQVLQDIANTLAPKPVTSAEWAAGTKVADAHGNPITAYKGMPVNNWRTGQPITELKSANGPWAGFFSSDPDVASGFAAAIHNGTRTPTPSMVMPAHIRMDNPFEVDAAGAPARNYQFDYPKEWKASANNPMMVDAINNPDYDGVIIRNTADEGDIFVPKRSDQIRSTLLPPQVASPKTTFGTLQKLRSDLLEIGRNNPDLVQNQSGGWLKRLSGTTDAAIMDGSNGLTPEDQAAFRAANAKWADMKATYDSPQSPLYTAVRTGNPDTLYNGNSLGDRTPTAVRNVMNRMDDNATGALRRGVVESALKTTRDGSANLKNFGLQWNRIPADYRAELFTAPQNAALRDVAAVGGLIGEDANPSGSAKVGQKVAEASALATSFAHPTGLLPLLQYPIAKAMNSPELVQWLMKAPKWQASGVQKLANEGVSGDVLTGLTKSTSGKMALAHAGMLTPKSAAMRGLVANVLAKSNQNQPGN